MRAESILVTFLSVSFIRPPESADVNYQQNVQPVPVLRLTLIFEVKKCIKNKKDMSQFHVVSCRGLQLSCMQLSQVNYQTKANGCKII